MKTSRLKGHNFEREIACQFREELRFYDCMTHREARGGDWSKTDLGIDLVNTEPFQIQCKRLQNYAPIQTINEIQCDRDKGDIPLLITKANNKETMCVLPWEDFKKILHMLHFSGQLTAQNNS